VQMQVNKVRVRHLINLPPGLRLGQGGDVHKRIPVRFRDSAALYRIDDRQPKITW
jgi:hypothetical protein